MKFVPSNSAFPEFMVMCEDQWDSLEGHIAVAWRSPRRTTESFVDDQLVTLSGPTMVVMRWQYTQRPDMQRPQRSVILLLLKFAYDVHSGQVYMDATRNPGCNPAVYDCLLPRRTWSEYRHYLDPFRNKTAADLAMAMSRETNRVLQAREAVLHQPVMPEFYLAFLQRPVFERGAVVRREASTALGKAVDDITDDELETFFKEQCFEGDGYFFVPQRYLARQGDYPVHPVDGSPRPEGEGKPGEWYRGGAWYFDDGRWNPAAQRPHRVYAQMGTVLGRPFRNPAFAVLKAKSFFPATLTYPAFMENPDLTELRAKQGDALDANSEVGKMLIDAMRKAMGRTGDMVSDDDLLDALDRPDAPLNLTFATGVQVVGCSRPVSSVSASWRLPGISILNLFNARPEWEEDWRVRPVPRWTAGSPEHGRASSTHAR